MNYLVHERYIMPIEMRQKLQVNATEPDEVLASGNNIVDRVGEQPEKRNVRAQLHRPAAGADDEMAGRDEPAETVSETTAQHIPLKGNGITTGEVNGIKPAQIVRLRAILIKGHEFKLLDAEPFECPSGRGEMQSTC